MLLVIAIVMASVSIGYSMFGLHDSDESFASFEPPSRRKSKAAENQALVSNDAYIKVEDSRKYFKYDVAGPKPIPGSARSHALPNAVPPSNTIPIEQAENKTYHISQRTNTSLPRSWAASGRYNWNHTYHDDFRTHYLYNPSILPLHNTLPRNTDNQYFDDPDALSETDLLALTGGDPSVRYIATFRAYTGCNCFGRRRGDRTLMTAGEQLSFLAIALLDEHLDIVNGTDILIDLNAGPSRGLYERNFLEDCRISLMRGGLYLLCNEELKSIRITRTAIQKDRKPSPLSQSHTVPPPGYGTKEGIRMPYVYPNIRGDGLTVTLLSQNVKMGGGKNFNIFRTTRQISTSKNNTGIASEADGGSSSAPIHEHYIQIFPAPHKYRRLNVPDGHGPDRIINRAALFSNPITKEKSLEETAPQERGLPKPSFDTPDSMHNISKCQENEEMNCTDVSFFDDEDDHGTACCVRVFLPQVQESKNGEEFNTDAANKSQGREVMVGITHQKTSPAKNFWLLDAHKRYDHFGVDRYVSRFVAYDTQHPFDVVARSGWFCLGFASDPIELKHPQRSTLAGKNKKFQLDLFDDVYDCPEIHFVSGFSEVVGNSSQAIIGYGVNDCHPRMFVVEKNEIVRLLNMG